MAKIMVKKISATDHLPGALPNAVRRAREHWSPAHGCEQPGVELWSNEFLEVEPQGRQNVLRHGDGPPTRQRLWRTDNNLSGHRPDNGTLDSNGTVQQVDIATLKTEHFSPS